jgi:hypothetical protein
VKRVDAETASRHFQASLVKYGRKLKKLADGKVCSTCRFYLSGGLCVKQDIEVHYTDAVACKRYEAR